MPSFASRTTLSSAFRFWFLISILFGVLLSDSSQFQPSSALFWDVAIFPAILIIYANTTLVTILSFSFRSLAQILRFIPVDEGFDNLIKELTFIVKWNFPNSSPLEENSTRKWIFIISRFIYSYTGDVISGSLAITVLISFLISRHEMPIYVFVIWAIWVVSYLKKNRAAILENYSDSTTNSDSTIV